MQSFYVKTGGRYRAANPTEICEAASAYVFAQVGRDRPALSSPIAAKQFITHQAGLDAEQFGVVYLDNRHRAIRIEILFRGTIDGASVHPREVVKAALREGAAGVILFHNHPSGIAEPSIADELITTRLKEALALVDVRVLDHLIVAGQNVTSFAEKGLL
jgi:DNA repair protein RadC